MNRREAWEKLLLNAHREIPDVAPSPDWNRKVLRDMHLLRAQIMAEPGGLPWGHLLDPGPLYSAWASGLAAVCAGAYAWAFLPSMDSEIFDVFVQPPAWFAGFFLGA